MDPNTVIAAATIVSTIYIIRDFVRRHKVTSVNYIEVPNKHGGIYTYNSEIEASGLKPAKIFVNSDNTVEVIFTNGEIRCFSNFIHWKKKAPETKAPSGTN